MVKDEYFSAVFKHQTSNIKHQTSTLMPNERFKFKQFHPISHE